MSKKDSQHVVPHDGQWAVRRSGAERVTQVFDTQQQAIDRARDISRNQGAELFIHRPDGKIRDRDSHGNDSFPPRG
jgi:uncharacterized protein YdaT